MPLRFNSAQERHCDVEHGHVGLESQCQLNGFAAVGSLANDVPSLLPLENLAETLTHDRVIVAEENSDS